MSRKYVMAASILFASIICSAHASPVGTPREITYKAAAERSLKLNLYLPPDSAHGPRPVVVWVHGGAWSRGSPSDLPSSNPNLYASLLQEGYAIAAVGYRLSGEASFPAPVQDINDALNFLHDHGKEHGVDAASVLMMGRSAGGHLAALVGLASGHEQHAFLGTPRYKVTGIVSFFGPTDLLISKGERSLTPERQARSSTARFLGAVPADQPDLARQASPISYVTSKSAPTMLLHGRKDRQVPLTHSLTLKAALEAQGVESSLRIEDDAAHSDRVFDSEAHVPAVLAFVKRHLPVNAASQP